MLQVKRGKGWLAFRRFRTRQDGLLKAVYRFTRTNVATKFKMRLQVRTQSGYAWEQGNSKPLTLVVLPRAARKPDADHRAKGGRQRQATQRIQRGRGQPLSLARARPALAGRP